MISLTPRQLVVLVLLTLVWGLNWPIMKVGVTGYPPLTFRALSLWLGLPLLALVVRALKLPFALPRRYWVGMAGLALFNMVLWHALIMLAIPQLSSGRAAILGYTMPIFQPCWAVPFLASGWRCAPGAAWPLLRWVCCCCSGTNSRSWAGAPWGCC